MKNFGLDIRRRICSHSRTRLQAHMNPSREQSAPSTNSSGLEITQTEKLHFGLPLDEDLKAGSISKTIRGQWSNISPQVRRTMDQALATTSNGAFMASVDNALSPFMKQANNLLALVGKGPADLAVQRKEYVTSLSLVPYERGMKSAFHWPRFLIPRSVAARCREDLRVDPIDADRSVLLLDQVMDRTSVIFCFSGYDLSGLNSGVKAWKNLLVELAGKVQILDIHMSEGWFSRRTHPLTRQILRSFRSEQDKNTEHKTTFIYRGKMNREILLDFHMYNKSLPSILLVDKRGYIRWHAVGIPTVESGKTMVELLEKLRREKT